MACRRSPGRPSSSRSPSHGARTGPSRAGSCGGRWMRPRYNRTRLGWCLLDGRDLLLVGDAEGGAAAAGRDHIGVLDLEPGALEPIDEVDHRAPDVWQTGVVDKQSNSLVLEHRVFRTLIVERKRVLEAGAAAAPYPDPEPRRFSDGTLRGEELADLLGPFVCESYHASFSIAMSPRYARRRVSDSRGAENSHRSRDPRRHRKCHRGWPPFQRRRIRAGVPRPAETRPAPAGLRRVRLRGG